MAARGLLHVEGGAREGVTLACKVCGYIGPRSGFAVSTKNIHGVSGRCKPCRAAQERARRARNLDRARMLDRQRVRAPEFREYQRRWIVENRERDNATKLRATHRRRARLAGNDARLVTPRDLARLALRQRGRCAYCGTRDLGLTVEHVVPTARGGRHAIGNIVLACFPCNRNKGALLLIEWRRLRVSGDRGRRHALHGGTT